MPRKTMSLQGPTVLCGASGTPNSAHNERNVSRSFWHFFLVSSTGADPGFEKGGFNLVPKRDTDGATSTY